MIEPDRDHFLHAARRLAAKDRYGLADPEDIGIELGIGLHQVTELVAGIRTCSIGLPFPSESCGPAENWRSSLLVFCAYAAWRGITGSLLIASNFFDIGTCSYLRPMPGVV